MRICLCTSGVNPLYSVISHLDGHELVGVFDFGADTSSMSLAKHYAYRLRTLVSKDAQDLHSRCVDDQIFHQYVDTKNQQSMTAATAAMKSLSPDLIVTFIVPMLPASFYGLASAGAINLHPSYLPEYRGGHSVFWMAADLVPAAAATVHFLSDELDNGDIIAQEKQAIPLGMAEPDVEHICVNQIGMKLVAKSITDIAAGTVERQSQPSKSPTRFAPFIDESSFAKRINWADYSIMQTWNILRFTQYWHGVLELPSGLSQLATWIAEESTECEHSHPLYNVVKIDGRYYFSHPEGLIKLRRSWQFKPALKKLQRILSSGQAGQLIPSI